MPPAHNIYAEQLSDLHRGHPLYHPEPRPEGPVEIGDVGYTKDGAFRRLFNASRPANDPIQRFGVPDDFVQLDLGVIDAYDAVLEPGPLHSRTISTLSTEVGTPGEMLPAEASFRFSCSSKRGAILMLETQMMREEAVQSRRLEAYVVQNCRSWHTFARDLDIHVGFGDLMLVTECSKTAAWSSAVYSNSSTEFGLSFSVGTAGISASSSLEKIGPVERRRSQKRAQGHDTPLPKDHTVFIKAYRVGMRQMYYRSLVALFMKARSSTLNQGDREGMGMTGTGSRPASAASDSSSSPAGAGGSLVIGPYEPDFNPSLVLLALEMEKNNDPEFVVLHDDVWCSMTPDSYGSQLMDEYTNFYFSNEVDTCLISILGEIPYDVGFSPSDLDESLLSHYPYSNAPPSSSLVGDMNSSDPLTDLVSSSSEPPLELISPALQEEMFAHLNTALALLTSMIGPNVETTTHTPPSGHLFGEEEIEDIARQVSHLLADRRLEAELQQSSTPGEDNSHVVSKDQSMDLFSSLCTPDVTPSEPLGADSTSSPRNAGGADCYSPIAVQLLNDLGESRLPESPLKLSPPGLSGEGVTSRPRSANKAGQDTFPELKQAVMDTTGQFPTITFEQRMKLAEETRQEQAHNAWVSFERAAREAERRGAKMLELLSEYYMLYPRDWREEPAPRRTRLPRKTHSRRRQPTDLREALDNDIHGQPSAHNPSAQPKVKQRAKGKVPMNTRPPYNSGNHNRGGPLAMVMEPDYAKVLSNRRTFAEYSEAVTPWAAPSGRSKNYPHHSPHTGPGDWGTAQGSTSTRHWSSDAAYRRGPQNPSYSRNGTSSYGTAHGFNDTHSDTDRPSGAPESNRPEPESMTHERATGRENRPGPRSERIPRTTPSGRLCREEEIAVQNLVQRGIALFGGSRRPVQDPLRGYGFAWQGPDTNELWIVGLKNTDTLRTEQRLLAVAYSMFAQIMGLSFDVTAAVELRSLVSEVWNSLTSGEREELCRIILQIAFVMEQTTE